jgi:uridine kinase
MKAKRAPLLIAIVGGSGAGKSWLAEQLQKKLGKTAARISLDDFYLDRSHLSPRRRALINFDHPRAIDWVSLEKVLQDCRAGRATRVPQYDFKTHSRRTGTAVLSPKPVILFDGLWVLRLARDLLSRGRERASVDHQFWKMVEPMNIQYVVAQARWAHILLKAPIKKTDVSHLAGQIRQQVK